MRKVTDGISQQDMRLSPPIVDGLWYCLCPSYRPLQLHRSIRTINTARETSRRCLSSASTTASTRVPLGERHKHETSYPTHNDFFSLPKESPPRNFKELQSQSIGDLETQLEQSTSRGRIDTSKTVAILKELLQRHRVTPTTRHYKAYLLTNIDRQHGSAKNVRDLLEEMAKQGITADSATLHAALEVSYPCRVWTGESITNSICKVLAVHPDYLLRQEVLEALRARWLSLSPVGWHHVIAGLLRENQFELALDRLDQMERKGILLEQWLHSLLVYKLSDADEFSEALRLIRSRPNKAKSISSAMWLYLLRAAMQRSHYETVEYVWKNAVDLGYQGLSVADCRDVLRFAAEYGNSTLAEAVFRHLSTLQTHLTGYDYGKLVQVYAGNADIKAAFGIVCHMHKHSISIEAEYTQLILQSLETQLSDPTVLWNDICGLKKEGFEIPITLANIVIQHTGNLLIRDSLSASRAIEIAVSIYKDLFDVCASGAITDTFNNLFSLCHQTHRRDICTFFAKEMAALDVTPDQRTLETLVLICLESGNRSSAEKYLADLKAQGWELSESATSQIRDKLA